jgi:hypothetical protein
MISKYQNIKISKFQNFKISFKCLINDLSHSKEISLENKNDE